MLLVLGRPEPPASLVPLEVRGGCQIQGAARVSLLEEVPKFGPIHVNPRATKPIRPFFGREPHDLGVVERSADDRIVKVRRGIERRGVVPLDAARLDPKVEGLGLGRVPARRRSQRIDQGRRADRELPHGGGHLGGRSE